MASPEEIIQGLQEALNQFSTDRFTSDLSKLSESLSRAGASTSQANNQAQSVLKQKTYQKLTSEYAKWVSAQKGLTRSQIAAMISQNKALASSRAKYIALSAAERNLTSERLKGIQAAQRGKNVFKALGGDVQMLGEKFKTFIKNLKGPKRLGANATPEERDAHERSSAAATAAREKVAGGAANAAATIKTATSDPIAAIKEMSLGWARAAGDVEVAGTKAGTTIEMVAKGLWSVAEAGVALYNLQKQNLAILQKSSAATGQFNEQWEDNKTIFANAIDSGSDLAKSISSLGEGFQDFVKDVATLRGAGLSINSKNVDEVYIKTKQLSMTTGQELGTVASQVSSFMQYFKKATEVDAVNALDDVASYAQRLAGMGGFGTVTKQMQDMISLGESLAETGASIESIASMTEQFGEIINKIKFPKGALGRVAKEITGITKASNEWLMYIGMKTGKGGAGGPIRSLFQMQGRSGVHGAQRNMDPAATALAAYKTIQRQTAGIRDPYMRRMAAEQIGQGIGLSPESFDILDEAVKSGTVGTKAVNEKLAKAGDHAKQTNEWLQNIYDVLNKRLIAKEVVAPAQSKESVMKAVEDAKKEGEKGRQNKPYTGAEIVQKRGAYIAEAGEGIVSASAMGNVRSTPITKSGGGGGGNQISLTINAGTGAAELKSAFEQCYQKALYAIQQSQRATFGV